MKTTPNSPIQTFGAALLLALGLAASLRAQVAPAASGATSAPATSTPASPADAPAPAPGASKDEVLTLSPFTVNQEANSVGYHTNDTTSGALMATPLTDLPLTIDIVNRNMMDDADLQSVAQAVTLVPGVAQMNKNEYDTESFAIRGFSTIDEFRNGIFFHGMTDETNLETAEVVKGPAAILYGIVQPGGIINYTTKQPFGTAQTTVEYQYGSYDFNKVDVDVNYPLGSEFEFRMPMSVTTANSYVNYTHTNAQFFNPVLVFNPDSKTSITLDFTYRRDTGTWNRGGYVAVQGVDATGAIVKNPEEPFSDWTSYPYINPYKFGEVGPYDTSNREHTFEEAIVEHRFSDDLSLRAEFAQENLRMEDTGSFDYVQNSAAYVGTPLSQIPVNGLVWLYDPFLEQVKEIQRHFEVDLFWKKEIGSWTNKVILGTQDQEAPSNIINFFWPGSLPPAVPLNSPDSVRFARGNIGSYVPWFSFQDPIITSLAPNWAQPDYYITDQLAGLNNKLHLLVGVRDQDFADINQRKLVPQGGVVYEFLSGISGYATYSVADQSNGITAGGPNVGNPRPTMNAKDFDVGIKASLMDHKLNASLDYFDITENNVAYSDLTSLLTQSGSLINQDTEIVSGRETSKGIEANLDYSPVKEATLSLGYSHDNAIDAKDGPTDQGARLPGAIKDEVTFMGKYTFLDAFDVGGGGTLAFGNIYYYLPASASYLSSIQYNGYKVYFAFAHYRTKLFGREVSLGVNVKNLTNEKYIVADYTVGDPREVFGTVSVRF